jgi:hypothetical protein
MELVGVLCLADVEPGLESWETSWGLAGLLGLGLRSLEIATVEVKVVKEAEEGNEAGLRSLRSAEWRGEDGHHFECVLCFVWNVVRYDVYVDESDEVCGSGREGFK